MVHRVSMYHYQDLKHAQQCGVLMVASLFCLIEMLTVVLIWSKASEA